MQWSVVIVFLFTALLCPVAAEKEYPEGYHPFLKDPSRTPPSVRKPPYTQTDEICNGILEDPEEVTRSLDNLCGDLNTGMLPRNPLGQNVLGASYPFELIKNQTLDLFSKTLPVLKEDKTLPKVAKFVTPNIPLKNRFKVVRRPVRSLHEESAEAKWQLISRTGKSLEGAEEKSEGSTWSGIIKGLFNGLSIDRSTAEGMLQNLEVDQKKAAGRGVSSFCRNNWGLFCMVYNSMLGRNNQEISSLEERKGEVPSMNAIDSDTPMTPCPSAVEYVTPVFARNYQGVWRYVVQIPYEGYFTQTVEVTQCLQDTCHYLTGSCMASPRWVSLLVAEIFYPDAVFPSVPGRPGLTRGPVSPSPHRPGNFQRRQGASGTLQAPAPHYCDGVDQIGCFQVRLYYDWFLVPGSCKCWKRNIFTPNGLRS